jgi:branched-chain amino acid transport system substrate-binding protein
VKLPNLVGVVGHGDSRASLMTAPIYNESHIPQIVPTGTSLLLKEAGQWTFMIAPDDVAEGAFIGDFVVGHLHARSATIFYQLDEYGRGLRDGVLKSFASRGVRIIDQVAFDWLHNPVSVIPEFDFPSLVAASLRRGKPDVVVIAGRSREAGEIVRLLHEQTPETRFVCADGVQAEPLFLDGAEFALNLCYLVAFWHHELNDEVSRAYVERFRRFHGRVPFAGEAMTHDAIMVLARAAREVGPNRSAIRKYLTELGATRPAYQGVTGRISFAKDRPARLLMIQVRNGVPVPVATN